MKLSFLIIMLFIESTTLNGQRDSLNTYAFHLNKSRKIADSRMVSQNAQNASDSDTDAPLEVKECRIFSGETNRDENILDEYLKNGKIVVHPNEGCLSIEIDPIAETPPAQIEYIYRLEGHCPNWFSSKEAILNFISLPYGDFTLAIRAKNASGDFSKHELRIPVSILRPFYLTAWFMGLVLLFLAAGAGFFLSYWKISVQKRHPKQKPLLPKMPPIALEHAVHLVSLPGPFSDRSSEDESWLQQLETVSLVSIGEHDFTISHLAKLMLMSESSLYRKVQELTGLTPNQYLKEKRLTKAFHLLEEKHVNSVKALAYAVGMKDVKYFSRNFKERFGSLPSELV